MDRTVPSEEESQRDHAQEAGVCRKSNMPPDGEVEKGAHGGNTAELGCPCCRRPAPDDVGAQALAQQVAFPEPAYL